MSERSERLAQGTTSAFLSLVLTALVVFGQQGCEESITPVKGFEVEPVNQAATELKRKCVEILRPKLHAGDLQTRLKVALALSSARDPAGLEDARAIMGGRSRETGLRAAHYFARNGLTPAEAAIADAEAMVKKARGSLRYLAVTTLGYSPRQDVKDMLKSISDDASDRDLQVCAACALARKADHQAIEWLRMNVSTWLGFEGFDPFLFARVADEGAMLKLMDSLEAGVDSRTRNAIMAAEAKRDNRSLSSLPILMTRKHGIRRTMAAAVLAELGGREGSNVLKEAVGQPVLALPEAAWAAMGLGSLGDPVGIWSLVKFLEKEQDTDKGVEAASLILPCLESPGYAVSASFQLWISVNM
ncbi:MAG: hypothetical protein JW759_02305 [Candidatus Coatesbacteria bacterium]|nr:hypothetical protein [Candidatus Coatesbacteria bacterium]